MNNATAATMDSLALQLKQEIDRTMADLEEQRACLRAEREELAAEKAKMSQLQPGRTDDIVELNVGGEFITTTRSTLTVVEGSMLAAMFSGRWEDKLTLDHGGRVLLDLNPYVMRKVIDHLRLKSMSKSATVPEPAISPDMQVEYDGVLDYLGLSKSVPVVSVATSHTPQISSVSDGDSRVLTNQGPGQNLGALSTVKIPVGGCWKVQVDKSAAGGGCCVGILGQPLNPTASKFHPPRYLWAWSRVVVVEGRTEIGRDGFQGIVADASYYFQLRDTELAMVQELPGGGTLSIYRVPVASEMAYHIHVQLHGQHTQARISPIDAAEAKRVGLI